MIKACRGAIQSMRLTAGRCEPTLVFAFVLVAQLAWLPLPASAPQMTNEVSQLWRRAEPPPVNILVYELRPPPAYMSPPLPRLFTIKSRYDVLINQFARAYQIDPALLKAVVHAESGFDSEAISRAGAMGLMQLMPETAALYRVNDPLAPKENIEAGAHYLRDLIELFDGDIQLALAAYNAGPGAVQRYARIPPYRETRGYVRKVMGLRELYALEL